MSQSDQGGAGRREVAYRLFAAEYEDADFSYSESDEERAPNYVVTPTGARVNRLFVVGVLTEVEQVNEDVLRGRIVDPTGAFVVYAGQYQPDEMAFLERAEPPMFVSVTGKARTFQPEDSDTVYTSVRPESINQVDAETRDRWTVTTAERTLDRVSTLADALAREERGDELRERLAAAGVDEGLASGTPMAIEHYGTTPSYLQALQETALDAARVVAGDRDEVESLTMAPDATGSATLSDLTDVDTAASQPTGESEPSTADSSTPSAEQSPSTDTETAAEPTASDQSTTEEPSETTAETGDTDATVSADTDTVTETASASTTEPETTESEPIESEPTETDAVAAEPDTGSESEPAVETGTTTETGGDEPSEPVTETTTADQPIGSAETDAGTGDDEDIGDFEPGEFELEDDERERIEEEFGTDFSTGTEVDDPGEAGIETPEPESDEAPEPETESEPEPDEAPEPETESEPEPEPEPEPEETPEPEPETTETAEADEAAEEPADEEPPEDVDLSAAVMETMRELNDGDGADRDELVASVADQYGAAHGDVEDAIEDALMDGRCYEPDDATLKPI